MISILIVHPLLGPHPEEMEGGEGVERSRINHQILDNIMSGHDQEIDSILLNNEEIRFMNYGAYPFHELTEMSLVRRKGIHPGLNTCGGRSSWISPGILRINRSELRDGAK